MMCTFSPIVSDKLMTYFCKVMLESERSLEFCQLSEDICRQGFKAVCHPDFRHAIRVSVCIESFPTQLDYESSLAHEATHGWLAWAKHYVRPLSTGDDVIDWRARTIHNLFEDLVIYETVEHEGFPAVSPLDVQDTGKQAEIIAEGTIEYMPSLHLDEDSQAIIRVVKHMCFTYSAKYIKGDASSEAIYQRYFQAYEERYLGEDKPHVEVVHKILGEQNIFDPVEFHNAVKELAQHFGLGTVQWESLRRSGHRRHGFH